MSTTSQRHPACASTGSKGPIDRSVLTDAFFGKRLERIARADDAGADAVFHHRKVSNLGFEHSVDGIEQTGRATSPCTRVLPSRSITLLLVIQGSSVCLTDGE
jgi:hypothetical protein